MSSWWRGRNGKSTLTYIIVGDLWWHIQNPLPLIFQVVLSHSLGDFLVYLLWYPTVIVRVASIFVPVGFYHEIPPLGVESPKVVTYNTAAIQLYESERFLKIEYFPHFYFLHGKHYESWRKNKTRKKCTQRAHTHTHTWIVVVFKLQTYVSCIVVWSCWVFLCWFEHVQYWANLHVWVYMWAFFGGGFPFLV